MTDNNTVSTQKIDIKLKALGEYISWLESILEQPVSANDNFLDIGGHSMIAISLNDRIKNKFGLSLSMERLYNATLDETFSTAQ
ncbi:phosphopantetheine-binding protein [Xenorhabdus bovienii]|uniref:phosphopantetheine-binding protein n=1 Tax=Xenorhabdus bovienii TaxID=40576 RepID=UPI0023B2FDF2|nr:phosphopantetheine-binding protein [Xenorhabdus bovienii]MDE9454649.1 hypothetical protein [Xenorhabdus bovienii]